MFALLNEFRSRTLRQDPRPFLISKTELNSFLYEPKAEWASPVNRAHVKRL